MQNLPSAEARWQILLTVAVHAVSNDTQMIFSRLDFRILLYKLLYITLDLIALSIPTWRKRRRMML